MVIQMQECSEKHPAGNLGERLGVPDYLPLLLFHLRYTVSPTIAVMSAALASANPTVASLLKGQDHELLLPSGTLRPAVVVMVVVGP